ncbi:hypothetical protein B0H14DRAFT_2896264, partial [Mycena olivaceomarginata]
YVHLFSGDEEAISPTVVPLESRYFSQEQRGRRGGCRLEGVGGNPLGAQHKPSARFSSCSHQRDAYLFLSNAVSPHISRTRILPASTAYSSRPDRARVVGDYAMANAAMLSENMDDLFWAHAIPGETIIWAMSHDNAPSRQDSGGFRDNDAGLRGLAPSVRFDLRPQVAGRRTRRSRPALSARTPTVRLPRPIIGGFHLWRPTHEGASSTTT